MPRAFYHSFDIDRLWIDKNPTTLALTTTYILCNFLAIQEKFLFGHHCTSNDFHRSTLIEEESSKSQFSGKKLHYIEKVVAICYV